MVVRTLFLVGLCLLGSAAASALYLVWLPDTAHLRSANPMTTRYVQIYVRRRLREGMRPATSMHWVPLASISPHLVRAVLIAEDDRFYLHGGVDWTAFKAAAAYNWKKKRMQRGASTISQQVARNLFLSPSRNVGRKIREILIARHLERSLGKERILEIYLNIVEWGDGIFGVEAAAQAYFGKSSSALTPAEAVELAAALPSPYDRNPNAPADEHLLKLRKLYLERLKRYGPADGNLRE